MLPAHTCRGKFSFQTDADDGGTTPGPENCCRELLRFASSCPAYPSNAESTWPQETEAHSARFTKTGRQRGAFQRGRLRNPIAIPETYICKTQLLGFAAFTRAVRAARVSRVIQASQNDSRNLCTIATDSTHRQPAWDASNPKNRADASSWLLTRRRREAFGAISVSREHRRF